MELPIPLLVLSDAPDQRSGLARVTRDLCSLLVGQPEWRVASCGWMGRGSVKLPWQQYHVHPSTFGEYDLPAIWDEFSSGQIGVIMTIWDLTRIGWLARPDLFDSAAREWALQVRSRVRLWGYIPVDSTGPSNKLTTMSRETLFGFDRLLAYSPFGEDVIRNTIGADEAAARDLSWMPHGYNGEVFKPGGSNAIQTEEDHAVGEVEAMVVPSVSGASGNGTETDTAGDADHREVRADHLAKGVRQHRATVKIGVVATNQQRKDWGACAAIARGLADVRDDVRFWWHTDSEIREWSLPALIADFNLTNVEITTEQFTDQQMAALYRTCALTLGIGAGEGFGYPLFESLACGVPVLHGDYAGGASLMRTCGLDGWLVQPMTYRLEGQHNCLRPVYDPAAWVKLIESTLKVTAELNKLELMPTQGIVAVVEHLDWRALGPRWRRWMRDGIGL